MPVLRNAKHEAFARAIAGGKTADAAYVEAGYKENRHNAAALAREEHISTRVREILSKVAEKAEWSFADRLQSLQAIHDASLTEDRRTAIAAINEANKMTGSYAPVKQEIDLRTSYTDLSDAELRETILKLMQRSAQQ